MLYEFLIENKDPIIALCRKKIASSGGTQTTSQLLEEGLPVFYSELIEVLTRTAANNSDIHADEAEKNGARAHGKESLKLGYTISQVVHTYGAVCQSITEQVEFKNSEINTKEFHDLNRCLDVAIAEAVTEYDKAHNELVVREEITRLGYFVHELGNSLSAASIAHTMIKDGRVGIHGSTSKLLSRALTRMRNLIDRGMAEVRLESRAFQPMELRVSDIVSEVEATAVVAARLKDITLEVETDTSLKINGDHELLVSAVSNLIQNAIKFTKPKGIVRLQTKALNNKVVIEVEDQCGGLPAEKIEELFQPFVRNEKDQTGMGLGLAISRRAVALNNGELSARTIQDKGCVFTITLPQV